MQEKDMKKRLDQELSEVAPDILQNILSQPRVPITDEKELLGEDAPLFKERKVIRPFVWAGAVAAVIALIFIITTFVNVNQKQVQNSSELAGKQMAYSILIDVNPSIEIRIGEDGYVEKVKAGNKDAKPIVEKVNKKLGKHASYEEAMQLVVHQLNKKYLKKKNSAMLVSVAAEDEKAIQGKTKEIKKTTDEIKKDEKVKCKTLYQKCVVTEKIEKISEKNKVSYGKAALCMKIAEKKEEKVDKLCKKSIPQLVKKAQKNGLVDEEDDMEIDEDAEELDSDYEEGTWEEETWEEETWEEETSEEETWEEESREEEMETIGSDDEEVATEPMEIAEPVSE